MSLNNRTLHARTRRREQGTILLVVVFIATAIAGLAAISAGRVVTAQRRQQSLEDEARALSSAYAQIQLAMNVVNTAIYDTENKNPELRDAVAGTYGGTAGVDGSPLPNQSATTAGGEATGYLKEATAKDGGSGVVIEWLQDPVDFAYYGFVRGTNVRVYHARDYLRRLDRLKNPDQPASDPDPFFESDGYFVLEAAGRSGDTVRLVSALVRENQPFSSFVFFQNRATLGVSGSPKGLIHCNESIAFYFPDGDYRDNVSAVQGFDYLAGATTENTRLLSANDAAGEIRLENTDFAQLQAAADPDNIDSDSGLFVGAAGLDADIRLYSDGRVRIKQYTQPYFDTITTTKMEYAGQEQVEVPKYIWVEDPNQPYQKKIFDHYEYSGGWVDVQVGTTTETYWTTEPVYELQTVTKYKSEKVWVPYSDGDAGGGTSVGGGGAGELGEWQTIQVPYETEEWVQTGTQPVEKTRSVPVYERQWSDTAVRTKVYRYETRYKKIQVQDGTKLVWQNIYNEVTYQQEIFVPPQYVSTDYVKLGLDTGSGDYHLKKGVIFIDGRIRDLKGDLLGRLTIVGDEKVRLTGNVRYVDENGRPAMLNGNDYTESYTPNPDYWTEYRAANRSKAPNSVLGIIARDDILFTARLPKQAELNGSLMSVEGRVGIDGFWADDATGELYKDYWSRKLGTYPNRDKYLTATERELERAYDASGWAYKTRRFKKDSLRRLGGIISNNRVMETYVRADKKTGTSKVDSGFKRGNMLFDMNLRFNPPPNFVEVPRPEVRNFLPVYISGNRDQ